MLGKTAGGLVWMYRYLERAENTSRLVETGQRIALTRSQSADDDWLSVLQTAGSLTGFQQKHDAITKDAAIDWLLRDADNPSSVRSVIKGARDNARMVRASVTHEVWSAVNAAWMRIDEPLRRKVPERDLPALLELIRQHTGLVRGATHGTMLRNDIYNFARLGTFIERADSTGRILDVKYYVLLPTAFSVGSSIDNVQWDTILRSVGAGGAYRMTHGQNTTAAEIADFLIFDSRMPRSLNFCLRKIRENLSHLEKDYGIAHPSCTEAEAQLQRFRQMTISDAFEAGLHEFVQAFLRDLAELSAQIERDYRFYE